MIKLMDWCCQHRRRNTEFLVLSLRRLEISIVTFGRSEPKVNIAINIRVRRAPAQHLQLITAHCAYYIEQP